MKRTLSLLLSCMLLLTGCTTNGSTNSIIETTQQSMSENVTISPHEENTDYSVPVESESENEPEITTFIEPEPLQIAIEPDVDGRAEYEQYVREKDFTLLNDPEMLQLLNDDIYSELELALADDNYIIENVESIYISKEYIEELEYNFRENIFFGYTLSELDAQFQGQKYLFTLGDDGQTTVKVFEEYDDTYEKALKKVAIGTGVILICVTVSVVTGGVGAPAAISTVFMASAKTATTMALSSGLISGVSSGVVTGMKTKNFDAALKAAAAQGSDAFMWGAISGAVMGGATEASNLIHSSHAASATVSDVPEIGQTALENATATTTDVPTWRQSEKYVYDMMGGSDQMSFINGKEVMYGTSGSTRPDVVHQVNGVFEAVEVKNYNLEANFYNLKNELTRQVSERVVNLPKGYTQKIVLDVRNRGYSTEFLMSRGSELQTALMDTYKNIPIDILTNNGSEIITLSVAA